MTSAFEQWPVWLIRLAWTGATIGVAYLLGHAISAFLAARLVRLATRTRRHWDDILVAELKRRIPFWSLLIGAWLALDYWPIEPRWLTFITRTISTLAIASVTLLVASVATRLVTTYGPRVSPAVPVSGLTQNLVRILVVTLGLLVILNGLNIEIRPMLAALGVGGLAVALALQEPLSNLFAGLFVTLAGQVRIGDYIKVDSGAEGFIRDFNWRSTRLQTIGGNFVIVPNSRLAQAVVSNFSLPSRECALTVDLGVDYGSDLARVEQIATAVATEVMQEVPGGLPESVPSIRFHTFADLGIRLSVNLRVREFPDQFLVRHELVKRLHARFAHEGVVLRPPAVISPPRT